MAYFDSLSHLAGFLLISDVSDLSNVIVYVTAFILLVDEEQGILPDLDKPPQRGIT